jgi:hypothetical protein
MNRKSKFSILVTALSLSIVLIVTPVVAAPPLTVHIEVPATINPDPDPFVATGPAVDAGALCPTGVSTDLSVVIVSNPPGNTIRILKVLKQFVCDDGSGTFDVNLVVNLDLMTHETTAHWRIVGGSGDYVGLQGNGNLIGTPIVPGSSIYDVYDGTIH